jgi:hypothetical protein
MFYASYARLRSLQNPRGYSKELLLKYPFVVMGILWVTWLSYWGIIIGILGKIPLTTALNVPEQYYITLFIIPWIVFIIGVFLLASYICWFLIKKSMKDKANHHGKKGHKKLELAIVTNQTTLENQTTITSLQNSLVSLTNGIKKYRISAEKKFIIIMASFWLQWY